MVADTYDESFPMFVTHTSIPQQVPLSSVVLRLPTISGSDVVVVLDDATGRKVAVDSGVLDRKTDDKRR